MVPSTPYLEREQIHKINRLLTDALVRTGREVAQTGRKGERYITEETKRLMKNRRILMKQGKRLTTEYEEINETIRKNIRMTKRRIQEGNIKERLNRTRT